LPLTSVRQTRKRFVSLPAIFTLSRHPISDLGKISALLLFRNNPGNYAAFLADGSPLIATLT
jgi:hypothetical protein